MLNAVIQFGFVTIFVAAFPLAPLCALVNNIIELRLDAYKLVKYYQRSAALKAQDIGAWYNILKFFAFIAVVSNVRIQISQRDFLVASSMNLLRRSYGLVSRLSQCLAVSNLHSRAKMHQIVFAITSSSLLL